MKSRRALVRKEEVLYQKSSVGDYIVAREKHRDFRWCSDLRLQRDVRWMFNAGLRVWTALLRTACGSGARGT